MSLSAILACIPPFSLLTLKHPRTGAQSPAFTDVRVEFGLTNVIPLFSCVPPLYAGSDVVLYAVAPTLSDPLTVTVSYRDCFVIALQLLPR